MMQNFALETLPAYMFAVYHTPQSKGKHALIISNGHFGGGRYREDPL